MATNVKRRPGQGGRWKNGPKLKNISVEDHAVHLSATLPVSSGESELGIWLAGGEFEKLAQAMMSADPTSAVRAFGVALSVYDLDGKRKLSDVLATVS